MTSVETSIIKMLKLNSIIYLQKENLNGKSVYFQRIFSKLKQKEKETRKSLLFLYTAAKI